MKYLKINLKTVIRIIKNNEEQMHELRKSMDENISCEIEILKRNNNEILEMKNSTLQIKIP